MLYCSYIGVSKTLFRELDLFFPINKYTGNSKARFALRKRRIRYKKQRDQELFVTLDNESDLMDDCTIKRPLQQLSLSESFKEMARRHHFRTLHDILNWPASVLLMHEGFTYHHYQELRNFLISMDAVHLLKTDSSKLV